MGNSIVHEKGNSSVNFENIFTYSCWTLIGLFVRRNDTAWREKTESNRTVDIPQLVRRAADGRLAFWALGLYGGASAFSNRVDVSCFTYTNKC